MLLQTNSYIVPREKREAHSRLLRKFRQVLLRLGCDHFEVYEQVGSNWSPGDATGRYVQIMRFRDRQHQQSVHAAEQTDPAAQAVIREFCSLINFPYQQQQGLFATGFYQSAIPIASARRPPDQPKRAAPVATPPPEAPEPAAGPQAAMDPIEPSDIPHENSAEMDPIVEVEDAAATEDSAEDCLEGLVSPATEPAEFVSGEIDDVDAPETDSDAGDERIDFDIDDSSEEPTDDDRYSASR